MATVRFLELAGDVPQLRAGCIRLDELEVALPVLALSSPRVRLFELSFASDASLDWPSIGRLRQEMLDLLDLQLPERLAGRAMLCLEVSDERLERASAHAALCLQADRAVPARILEIALTHAGSYESVDEQVAAWRALLSSNSQPFVRRRIERAPPQESRSASTSREVLRKLLADTSCFRDSANVGRGLVGDPRHSNPKMVASRARKRDLIFGVWDGNAYRYPSFQFDAEGQPFAQAAELVDVLPHDPDGSGRDAALWLFAPDAALDGQTPAEAFATHPQRVIELARMRREGSSAAD